MTTLKTTLYLLAILFAYGVAGHMDYDDAVMLEKAQRTTVVADCPTDRTLDTHQPAAKAIDPPFDPTDIGADERSGSEGVTCVSQAL